MKTIIISIRSLWACKILNGEKSIEVRKGLALYNALKKAEERGEEVEFLMYVTKAKPSLLLASGISASEDDDKPSIHFEEKIASLGEITKLEKDVDNMVRKRFPAGCCYALTPYDLNGKVVAKFALKKYEKIYWSLSDYIGDDEKRLKTPSLHDYELADKACLEIEKLYDYFADGDSVGSALYISNLEIFDKPKTLADYGLKRVPQSWCYAEEKKS